MSQQKYCPSCGDILNTGSRTCTCGWKAKSSNQVYDDPNHGRCSYSNGAERCPLPGTISDSTRCVVGTPFYCRFHAGIHGDRSKCDQILQAIKRKEIGIRKVDWRDELIAEVMQRRPNRQAA